MPLYPFHCRECDHEFDALIPRATDDPQAECPACGGAKTDRGFGVPARSPAAVTPPVGSGCGVGPPCGRTGCRRVSNSSL
jgi:putative FmdB family regulatory protein